MEKILFVNACIRGRELSRTFRLAQAFLGEYQKTHPCQIEEADLTGMTLEYLNSDRLNRRDGLIAENAFDAPELAPAKQFAAADKIVIAAPFWDLSFPAVLKVYLENICVNGLTFAYDDQGHIVKRCKASKMMFVTTRGGVFSTGPAQPFEIIPFLKAMSCCFGIWDFQSIIAEGLDIASNDAEELLAKAIFNAVKAARIF
jgi:FMN-dependent NADH-azoreductase